MRAARAHENDGRGRRENEDADEDRERDEFVLPQAREALRHLLEHGLRGGGRGGDQAGKGGWAAAQPNAQCSALPLAPLKHSAAIHLEGLA